MQWNQKPKRNMTSTMAGSSKNFDDGIAAQWRSWANSEVVYTEDFPAGLLTGTELPDNSLAKGATRFEWIFDITNPHAAKFIARDNGHGIENQRSLLRLCKIGSKESSSAYNQYGQGRICTLTKFARNYEAAVWSATFKNCGNPKNLSQISHPWRSSDEMQTSMIDIPIDATNHDLGFEWDITFDASNADILGEELASDARKLFNKTKERLTTKYSKTVFDKTEFILTVKNATQTITESSRTNKWKTLKQMFEELPSSCITTIYNETFKWKSIQVRVTEYLLLTFAKTKEPAALVALRTAFPTFGTRSMSAQRVHISNDGRLIESRPKSEMDSKILHNSDNGGIVFIDTDSTVAGGDFNDQPEPCTIKVSIKKECENLKGIYKMYRDEKKRRAEEDRIIAAKEKAEKAAKEKAEKAARAAKESAEKAAKEKAMLEAVAKEVSLKKQTKPLTTQKKPHVSSDVEDSLVSVHRKIEVTGGGAAAQLAKQSEPEYEPLSPSMPVLHCVPTFPDPIPISAPQLAKQSEPEYEPLSPSMPVLHCVPTFPDPIPISAPQQQQQQQQQQLFSIIDMKEMMKMSLSLMSTENAQKFKSMIKVKYGFDDTSV